MAAKGGHWKGETFVPVKSTQLVDRMMANAVSMSRLREVARAAERRATTARTKGERAKWMQRARELERRSQERGAAMDRTQRVLEDRTGRVARPHHITRGRWHVELGPATVLRPSHAREHRDSLQSMAGILERHLRERKDDFGRPIGEHQAAVLGVRLRRAQRNLAEHDAKYDAQGLARGREREQARATMADAKIQVARLRQERDQRRQRRARVMEHRAAVEAMRERRGRVEELRAIRDERRRASAERRARVEGRGGGAKKIRPALPAAPNEIGRVTYQHHGKWYGMVVTGEGKTARGTSTYHLLPDGRWGAGREKTPGVVRAQLRAAIKRRGIELTF